MSIYIYYIYIFYERPGNMLDQFSHRTELDRSHPLIGKTDEIWGIRSTLKVFLCQVSSISKCRTGARPRHQFGGPQLSASHSISCVQKITFCSMTWLAVPSTWLIASSVLWTSKCSRRLQPIRSIAYLPLAHDDSNIPYDPCWLWANYRSCLEA